MLSSFSCWLFNIYKINFSPVSFFWWGNAYKQHLISDSSHSRCSSHLSQCCQQILGEPPFLHHKNNEPPPQFFLFRMCYYLAMQSLVTSVLTSMSFKSGFKIRSTHSLVMKESTRHVFIFPWVSQWTNKFFCSLYFFKLLAIACIHPQ